MIDPQIIQAAKEIRRKYLNIVDELNSNQKDLQKLADFLNKKMEDLKRIEKEEFKNKPTKEEVTRVTSIIVKEIEEIELNEKRLSKKFMKMNEELEQLQKEEKILYTTIKARLPSLKDEEIKKEIAKYLDE